MKGYLIAFLVGVAIPFGLFFLWWMGTRVFRAALRLFLGIALVLLMLAVWAQGADREELDQEEPAAELEEPSRLYKVMGWATWGGQAGDFASTEYLIENGGYERNPLMRNRGVRIGSVVAFPLVSNYLSEELRKEGHPKLALWMRIAVVGLKGYAIAHNLRELK